MKLLPVHCCCEPAKRLGWVELPDHLVRCGQVLFVIPPRFARAPIPRELQGIDGTMEPSQKIYTVVEYLAGYQGRDEFLAVKSAHLPVETWAQVPGFRREP